MKKYSKKQRIKLLQESLNKAEESLNKAERYLREDQAVITALRARMEDDHNAIKKHRDARQAIAYHLGQLDGTYNITRTTADIVNFLALSGQSDMLLIKASTLCLMSYSHGYTAGQKLHAAAKKES